MKKFLTLFILSAFSPAFTCGQSVNEKEVFELTYKGLADANNLKYDPLTGNYCYIYYIKDENKAFIITKNSLSDKYDYIVQDDIHFDDKGNYYVVVSDYKVDYGTNNYFLISNGKTIKNYDYMESYSSFMNKKNEFEFVFKENDVYKIGFYSVDGGFRESGPYDNVRVAFAPNAASGQSEGESESYDEEDFYHNENGERAFIATSGGKAKIIFETSEIETNYSDINDASLMINKNNELSFIAKNGGRFYQQYGNEFVVSGKREYDKFDIVSVPLQFTTLNEPVYLVGDSVAEDKYNYSVAVGNQIQRAYTDEGKSTKAPDFSSYISDIKPGDDGGLTYVGNTEVVVPAVKTKPDEASYDTYYSRTFFVKNGIANELGYNINTIKYLDNGNLLYAGLADIKKKQSLLMLNYGPSKVIINKKMFDEIFDYGMSPSNEIYYVGQYYEDPEKNQKYEAYLYIGDKQISKSDNFVSQAGDSVYSILKFDSKNNYAYVTDTRIDSMTTKDQIFTNNGPLAFPENVSGVKTFSLITNLMYTADDKLFYIADTKTDPVTFDITKELFYENKSLGKTYTSIYDLEYDDEKDQITFVGARGSKVYQVTIQL